MTWIVKTTSNDFLVVEEFEFVNLANIATSWVVKSGASVNVTCKMD